MFHYFKLKLIKKQPFYRAMHLVQSAVSVCLSVCL